MLLEVFAGTLSLDPQISRASETRLSELKRTPGFVAACLDVIASLANCLHEQRGVVTAIAIYFKNIIMRHWHSNDDEPSIIDHDEKPIIRERMLRIMVDADFIIKRQLIPLLRKLIAETAVLSSWPQLLNETGYLLQQVPNGNDLASLLADPTGNQRMWSPLYVGLVSFSEFCRKYRWINNADRSKDLDPIIIQVFPHLLNVGNLIIENPGLITELTSEMVKLILKCYKFVTYFDLPVVLQTRDAMFTWGEFHGKIINLATPTYITNDPSSSEQNKNLLEFSKCMKWSVFNMKKLFEKHASRVKEYGEFLAIFMKEFIPHLIPNYLSIVEAWCQGSKWIPHLALYGMLETFSVCVLTKSTWLILQPHYETLLQHLIFPLACPTDDVLETFEVDPQEYIRINYDIFEDYVSPDVAALGLLATCISKRKPCLTTAIQFVYGILTELQKQPETLEVAKKKEGCLRIVGTISREVTLPTSKYLDEMEPFLANLIYPNLTSSFQFLRARTLHVAYKFDALQYKDEKCLAMLFSGILAPFKEHPAGSSNSAAEEPSLPVLLEAALCVEAYINQEQFQELLRGMILPVMSKLLELSNEIDSEEVSIVMQECVKKYSAQLQPFGIDLMTKSVEIFMRLVVEIYNASEANYDDDYDDLNAKIISAMEVLNMIITVLKSFEHLAEVLAKLEEVFMPAVKFVMVYQISDLFAEVLDLIESNIFIAKTVSPHMWEAFDWIVNHFRDGTAFLYFDEWISTLETYIIFGQEQFANGPIELNQGLQFIITSILTGDDLDVGYADIIYGFEMSLFYFLAIREGRRAEIDIQGVLNAAMSSYQKLEVESNQSNHPLTLWFFIHLHNLILTGLVADFETTIGVLDNVKYRLLFFEQWIGQCLQLKRVFDLKLSIMGMITILSRADVLLPTLPEKVQQSLPLVFAKLVGKIPRALSEFTRKQKLFNELTSEYQADDELMFNSYKYSNFDDEEFDEEEFENEGAEGGATGGETVQTSEYIDFLKVEQEKLKQYTGFEAEDDNEADEFDEETFTATPIDNLDILQITRTYLENLQMGNLDAYNQLIQGMSEEDRQGLLVALTSN